MHTHHAFIINHKNLMMTSCQHVHKHTKTTHACTRFVHGEMLHHVSKNCIPNARGNVTPMHGETLHHFPKSTKN